ncbi:MAG: hydroxyethylthiazole kinase [Actinobacteria bacterium]|nr:hydroxyethylthiazole kinase [Actinomycetota bacterium]
MIKEIAGDLQRIKEEKPLIHHITNFVVMNETANVTLCLGALPVMAHAKDEVAEMVSFAGALLLNIGTLTTELVDSMVIAGKRANELSIPVILDPVGAGATKLRTDASRRILDEVAIAIIRGNSAEIGVLAGAGGEIKGVEAVGKDEKIVDVARGLAAREKCVVSVTGPEDIITDGERVALVKNGDPMMATITGTGCMSTTITAGFASIQKDYLKAATGALVTFGIAGEKAATMTRGKPGSFHAALYDSVYAVDYDIILKEAKLELVLPVKA